MMRSDHIHIIKCYRGFKVRFLLVSFVSLVSIFNLYILFSTKNVPKATRSFVKRNDGVIINTLFDIQGDFIFDDIYLSNMAVLPYERGGSSSDRIISQMRFVPQNYLTGSDYKVIFVDDNKLTNIDTTMCPVKRCSFTFKERFRDSADAVLLMALSYPYYTYKSHQIVILFAIESPVYADVGVVENVIKSFNWTATYRFDADIVTPYYKVVAHDNTKPWPDKYPLPLEDYSLNKKDAVAWFVSNCFTVNKRIEFAKLLSSYIKVDIYGECGFLKCNKGNSKECFLLLQNYWFYLAFENSNCRHYITEKFYSNALNNSVVPIVLGAHPDDLKLVAPPHSYIHVEDFSNMSSLVNYLKYLMANKTAYNEYFAWKAHMKLDTNTFFWCRLCSLIHHAAGKRQPDVEYMRRWWDDSTSCSKTTWTIKQYW